MGYGVWDSGFWGPRFKSRRGPRIIEARDPSPGPLSLVFIGSFLADVWAISVSSSGGHLVTQSKLLAKFLRPTVKLRILQPKPQIHQKIMRYPLAAKYSTPLQELAQHFSAVLSRTVEVRLSGLQDLGIKVQRLIKNRDTQGLCRDYIVVTGVVRKPTGPCNPLEKYMRLPYCSDKTTFEAFR